MVVSLATIFYWEKETIMEFKLFSKLGSLEGIELYMLIGGLVILGLLIWAVASYAKRARQRHSKRPKPRRQNPTARRCSSTARCRSRSRSC